MPARARLPARRWGVLALLLGLACHRSAATAGDSQAAAPPPPRLAAATVADRVHVFLISPGDGGRSGRAVGCGDSAVPVEVPLARPQPALPGALAALLAMRGTYNHGARLVNALYASPLTLARIERDGGLARVHLTGYIELAGGCENARMVAELTATALQFVDVERVEFLLDGQPLAALVQAAATPAPAAPAPPDPGARSAPPPPPAPPR